jgi:hypothetical protein
LQLTNLWNGTKLLFDTTIPEIQEFTKRLQSNIVLKLLLYNLHRNMFIFIYFLTIQLAQRNSLPDTVLGCFKFNTKIHPTIWGIPVHISVHYRRQFHDTGPRHDFVGDEKAQAGHTIVHLIQPFLTFICHTFYTNPKLLLLYAGYLLRYYCNN